MEWQPIETLPENGPNVIIVSDGVNVAAAGNYLRRPGDPFDDLEHWDYDGYEELGWTPTLWMPLPPPPAQGIVTASADETHSGSVPKG